MAGRRLDPEERALWRKVTDSVRPLVRLAEPRPAIADTPGLPETAATPIDTPKEARAGRVARLQKLPTPPVAARAKATPGETLDGGWDRRLARGMVAPDISIDLHGHTLASAHDALEDGLARALAQEARLLLLVTGKPPAERGDGGGPRRGLIRAAVGDWLAASSHAGRIAAVRNAHPRHGGAGALYIVMRRRRS